MQLEGSVSRHILPFTREEVFWRGVEYAKNGQVREAREEGENIKANVEGSAAYDVEIWQEAENIRANCMCAYALNGDYCKHVVALGAYWDLARNLSLPEAEEVASYALQEVHSRCLAADCILCSWK